MYLFLKVTIQNRVRAMTRKRYQVQAVGYVRTSSATNVGPDKDSEKRQRLAIERFAKSAGFALVDWFTDPAVSGADPIETRPGFGALLDRVENNGVRVVLVEDASRFARDLVAQELGVIMLIKRGMRVITASGDDMTEASDPSRIMMRQIAGSFAQYEKARLVRKLREARERKKAETGKCGGRHSYAEREGGAELIALARQLRRPDPNRRPISLRNVAARLAERGHVSASGKPYVASAVASMLGE